MAKRRGSRRRSHKRPQKMIGCNGMIMGGSGAAEFGVAAYGGSDQQHAIPGSNLIAVNQISPEIASSIAAMPASAPAIQAGGKKDQDGGQGIVTDLAVPAVLLYANQNFGTRARKPHFRHHRRSRRNGRRSRRRR